MKKILKSVFAALLASVALSSCMEDGPETVSYLPVTANNISGTWQLSEWLGKPVPAGSYVYMDIVRRDTEFTLYYNLETFSPYVRTGIYSVDEETGVISGRYDHYAGDWTHSYTVSELTRDRMVWTAVDDPQDVSVYVRVDSVPEDIKGTDTPDEGGDAGSGDTAE